jgi:hypothetical protein
MVFVFSRGYELDLSYGNTDRALGLIERVADVLERTYLAPRKQGLDVELPDQMMRYAHQAVNHLCNMEPDQEERRLVLQARFLHLGNEFGFSAAGYTERKQEYNDKDPDNSLLKHEKQDFYVWHPHGEVIVQMAGEFEGKADWRDREFGPVCEYKGAKAFKLEFRKNPGITSAGNDTAFALHYNGPEDDFTVSVNIRFRRGDVIGVNGVVNMFQPESSPIPFFNTTSLEDTLELFKDRANITPGLLHEIITRSNLTEENQRDLQELIAKTGE